MIGLGLELVVPLLAAGPAPASANSSWRRLFVGKVALAAVALPIVGLALLRGFC